MKYNILIQQKVITDNNLNIDLVDAAILEIISEMPSSSKIEKKYEGNIVFFWVNHLNLAKENPILRIKTADGIYRRMLKMAELGFIHIHPANKQSKKSFYAISDLTTSLFISGTSDEKPSIDELHRMKNRSDIGFKSEVTSDEKPKDYIINDYTINDNILNINDDLKKSSDKKEAHKSFKPMVKYFCEEYWPTYDFKGPRDGKQINEIIKQIEKLFEKNGREVTPDSVTEFFKMVIQNLPKFYQFKNLTKINSGFSEIIEEIKNSKNGQQKPLTRNQQVAEESRAFQERIRARAARSNS